MLYGGRISLAVGLAAMLIAHRRRHHRRRRSPACRAARVEHGADVAHRPVPVAAAAAAAAARSIYLFRDSLKKVFGPEGGVFILIVAVIGGLRWMPVARLVRAQFLSLREKEFVEAARALGASRRARWCATSCPTRWAR